VFKIPCDDQHISFAPDSDTNKTILVTSNSSDAADQFIKGARTAYVQTMGEIGILITAIRPNLPNDKPIPSFVLPDYS
jgi:hypothetical protein